jgi:hypothetical protein
MQTESKLDADILGYMMFRLLFGTQDDRYEPSVARYVVETVGALNEASCRVTVRLAVLEAIRQISKEMN